MRKDTSEELQRLSDALLMEDEPEEAYWEITLDEDDIPVEDVAEYNNHANNYGCAYNTDRTELSSEELSEALLSAEDTEKGSGKLLLLAVLLTLAILGVAIYWVVAR